MKGPSAPEHLDALFGTVTARLEGLVVPRRTGTAIAPSPSRHRTELVACVQTMGQLYQMLMQELARSQELERHVLETQATLDRIHAELTGTRDEERHARHLALHDSLTQLPNRRFFVERLEQVLAQRDTHPGTLAVLFLDLDAFKPINDAHGHHVGDELLQIVGARLGRLLRSGDMVSRLGGDEFACLCDGLSSREQIGHLADKLFAAVAAPMQIGALNLSVRPSIGIALCPQDGHRVAELLQRADAAMYRAKRERCRHAFFAASGG
ncbi:GGDEF domain-containing protein [Ideonella benzenivorans]|uniref:GGDEF domain-containing protein n=1 Tax=Ideonella benzenivorans TaxID=2831643 RepID=UPI001CED9650|nr:GGDEF domain-containing protein [Ideonella benzenivorans]